MEDVLKEKITLLQENLVKKYEEENKLGGDSLQLMLDSIQSDVQEKLSEVIKSKVKTEFISSFEDLVLPVFEKYLQKIFEKVCATFEKGHKFYVDRLSIENSKFNNLRENLNTLLTNFINASDNIRKTVQDTAQLQFNLNKTYSDTIFKSEFSNLNSKLESIVDRQSDILTCLLGMEGRIQTIEKSQSNQDSFFKDLNQKISMMNQKITGILYKWFGSCLYVEKIYVNL